MQDRIASFLGTVAQAITAARYFPESTYRLQFYAGFTFRDALEIVPYVHDLGITHYYASPLLQSRQGSTHGYDITSYQVLNPELGTAADYEALCQALQAHDMGQVLDIVPNHMGIAGNDNLWWHDVLENGPSSPYAGFFDIAWYASPRLEMHGRVLLPILGTSYGAALESQQLRLEYAAGAFTVHYFEHRFPVAPQSYAMILEYRHDELVGLLEEEARARSADAVAGNGGPLSGVPSADTVAGNVEPLAEYDSILTAIGHLPPSSTTDPDRMAERQREKEVIKRRLAALTDASPVVQRFIEHNVALFNGILGQPASFDLLDALLQAQVYRLCHWRVASEEINYRRFFDVNELAALRMEKPEVFAATHELVLRLLSEGKVHGVRIDHPDGLYDPLQYLQRLQQHYVLSMAQRLCDVEAADQEMAAEIVQASDAERALMHRPLYVVVEKILAAHEALREDWPVYGTSGYRVLNMLNGLFVDASNRQPLTRIYRDWTQDTSSFADVVYDAKSLIMQVSLSSEVYMLTYQLDRLAQQHRWSRDFTFNSLQHALQEVIACFPVYRSYITSDELHPDDRRYVQQAVARAQRRNPAVSRELFEFVRDMLLLNYPESASAADQAEQRDFVGKFQQVTGPVMAKGLEDTACYRYNRLLSLNEVGGDADRFGVSPEELHRAFEERQATWPLAFSALSTHDTKRSEDVRARLNVLSELPEEWQACLQRWSNYNAPYRQTIDDEPVPDANEEYLLYQTLLGAWPLEPYTTVEYATFVERIQAYILKALREAKVHSSWINPHPAYDAAVQHYVAQTLDAHSNTAFLDDFRAFQRRISHYGLLNSLSQTLLKITVPGVPDTYQGTELWDFSLVDPDNRRPVDYQRRYRLLRELQAKMTASGADQRGLVHELLTSKEDGRIKLYITFLALNCRRAHPGLFTVGDYRPAQTLGAKRQHIFSFSRRQGTCAAVVAVPRLMARLCQESPEGVPMGTVWQDTRLLVPGIDPDWHWRNVLTGERVAYSMDEGQPSLRLAELLAHFPVALLVGHQQPA